GISFAGLTLGGAVNTSSIAINSGAGNVTGKAVLTTNNIGSVTLQSTSGSFGTSKTNRVFVSTPGLDVITTSGSSFITDNKTGTAAGTINVSGLSTTGTGTIDFVSLGSTNINGDSNGDLLGASISLTLANSTNINANISATAAFSLSETGAGSTNFN